MASGTESTLARRLVLRDALDSQLNKSGRPDGVCIVSAAISWHFSPIRVHGPLVQSLDVMILLHAIQRDCINVAMGRPTATMSEQNKSRRWEVTNKSQAEGAGGL